MILRPFNEISNDQEIAGKAHPLDDAQFKIKPVVIVFSICRHRLHRQTRVQAFAGLASQFFQFVIGEFRQNLFACQRAIGAALCDLNRRFNCFWQIIKQRDHLVAAFEIVFGGQLAAVVFSDIASISNTKHRIMRAVHLALRKMNVIRRNNRFVIVISPIKERRFRRLLVGSPPRAFRDIAMPLQFDVKPIRKDRSHLVQMRQREGGLALPDQSSCRTIRASGETDQTL